MGSISFTIENYKNRKTYTARSLDESLEVDQVLLESIRKVCNEERIYKFLFKDKLQNKPYSIENAESLIRWGKKGWTENTWFVFLIFNSENQLVGAMDIKSNNKDQAEIGYWLSKYASGVMSNAIARLTIYAEENGYKKLYGEILPTNYKSIKVLVRNGFDRMTLVQRKNKDYFRLEINL